MKAQSNISQPAKYTTTTNIIYETTPEVFVDITSSLPLHLFAPPRHVRHRLLTSQPEMNEQKKGRNVNEWTTFIIGLKITESLSSTPKGGRRRTRKKEKRERER